MTLIATIAASRDQVLAAAEEILREFVPTLEHMDDSGAVSDYSIRQNFSEEQLSVFDTLGWDRRTLRREAGRMYRVVRLQAQAGTAEEREADRKAAADAAAELDAQDDKILAELAKWQRKLEALQDAARDTAAVVAKREEAIVRLRETVPQHVLDRHRRRHREIAEEFAELKAGAATVHELAELEEQRKLEFAEAAKLLDVYLK